MFLECNTLDEKIAMLQSAHGPGVCMALFLSSKTSSGPPNKAVAIAKYGHVMCGQHSVDMDVRGNVMVSGEPLSSIQQMAAFGNAPGSILPYIVACIHHTMQTCYRACPIILLTTIALVHETKRHTLVGWPLHFHYTNL